MKFGVKGISMVRCDRFVIEFNFNKENIYSDEYVLGYVPHPVIYDRVMKHDIVEINTGDDDIDMELAEAVLTMLNIKYIAKTEKTT